MRSINAFDDWIDGYYLRSEILKYGGEIDGSTTANAFGILSGLQKTSDPTDGELKSGFLRSGDGFGGLRPASPSLGWSCWTHDCVFSCVGVEERSLMDKDETEGLRIYREGTGVELLAVDENDVFSFNWLRRKGRDFQRGINLLGALIRKLFPRE